MSEEKEKHNCLKRFTHKTTQLFWRKMNTTTDGLSAQEAQKAFRNVRGKMC